MMTAAGTQVPAPPLHLAAARPWYGTQRHFGKYLTRARTWQIAQVPRATGHTFLDYT
ncbi:TPA: hypothetical protein QDC03_001362 [Burkholderia cepacia]|uniref:hypothetical protein n=2 Tax=Burkholderia TaxID=32008 RepID=UPI000AC472DD|nr:MULTISPECIES: hypothetical protein [Burkholderia cepacia complex]EKS9888844.1 hypothetical protein [Burkholderia pyrrocinia]HDR9506315.1 hypothetical protein [Burkholderia cepacia]